MLRNALIQITHHDFTRDFRGEFLKAAAAAGDIALHIQCGTTRRLTEVRVDGTFPRAWSSLPELRAILDEKIGPACRIALTGVGGAYAPDVEAVTRLFPRQRRFYDVQDDLSYGAVGLKYLKFLVRDMRWRRLCGRVLLLEPGMKRYYPTGYHLDNASHILNGRTPALPIKAVYIGSMDQRLDLPLLKALSERIPIDIFGRFHESANDVERSLASLLRQTDRICFRGAYDGTGLGELLRPYSIGLLPYKTGHRMTRHVNPDKIYHYLNAGLGVVTTAIPQALRMGDKVAILENAESFVAAAEQAITRARANWNPEDYLWQTRWTELCRHAGAV